MKTSKIKNMIYQSLSTIEDLKGCVINNSACRIGMFHTTASGVFDSVHRHFMDITGTTGNQVIGKVWLQAVTCDDRDRACKEWYQSIMYNRLYTGSFRIADRVRGGLKEVSCSLVPEMTDDKQTIGYYGVFVETAEYQQAV